MIRPTWDQYFFGVLSVIKLRASCLRRQGGAIIVDIDKKIISTGYNGPPSGLPNCIETPCGGENDTTGNTQNCIALHAEHNAIFYAGDKIRYADMLYTTTFPCMKCALEICQTPIKRIIYLEDYADGRGRSLLLAKNIFLKKGELF